MLHEEDDILDEIYAANEMYANLGIVQNPKLNTSKSLLYNSLKYNTEMFLKTHSDIIKNFKHISKNTKYNGLTSKAAERYSGLDSAMKVIDHTILDEFDLALRSGQQDDEVLMSVLNLYDNFIPQLKNNTVNHIGSKKFYRRGGKTFSKSKTKTLVELATVNRICAGEMIFFVYCDMINLSWPLFVANISCVVMFSIQL